MKLDKINWILTDDDLLNLKDLEILTFISQRLQITANVLSDEVALILLDAIYRVLDSAWPSRHRHFYRTLYNCS